MDSTKFCSNCGTPITESEKFCGSCGVKVEAVTAKAAEPVQQQPVQPEPVQEGVAPLHPYLLLLHKNKKTN